MGGWGNGFVNQTAFKILILAPREAWRERMLEPAFEEKRAELLDSNHASERGGAGS